jgi:hypothetical protein
VVENTGGTIQAVTSGHVLISSGIYLTEPLGGGSVKVVTAGNSCI